MNVISIMARRTAPAPTMQAASARRRTGFSGGRPWSSSTTTFSEVPVIGPLLHLGHLRAEELERGLSVDAELSGRLHPGLFHGSEALLDRGHERVVCFKELRACRLHLRL